jgi:hypothetical protein
MYAPLPAFRRWLTEDSPALRVEALVSRCVEKDREHRYGSAAELLRALTPHRVPDRTLRLPRPMEPKPLGVSHDAEPAPAPRGSRPSARSSAVTLVPFGRGHDDEGSRGRGLRYSNLLQWAIVGCCLGTLILVLVYWLGGGRS